jgi:biopolymer transport protein ExbD
MAGGGSRMADEGKKKARIEIIPLIDVIFFLLATFVLFTLSLDKIQSLPVTLPVPSPSSNEKPPDDDVTLQVSDQNTCYWNKELVGMDEIEGRIEQYKSQVAEPRILITGDEKAKFGSTIRVLDLVRKAGIQQVSVETNVRQTGR